MALMMLNAASTARIKRAVHKSPITIRSKRSILLSRGNKGGRPKVVRPGPLPQAGCKVAEA